MSSNIPGTDLSCEGDQTENSNSISSRDSTTEYFLVEGSSVIVRYPPVFSKPKVSSCCINGPGSPRRPHPAPQPRDDPGAPAPVPRTRGTRRTDGKVVLPCPGCEEPRVPPLPNEFFAFCKTHVNYFNNSQIPKGEPKYKHTCGKKCVKKCMKMCKKMCKKM